MKQSNELQTWPDCVNPGKCPGACAYCKRRKDGPRWWLRGAGAKVKAAADMGVCWIRRVTREQLLEKYPNDRGAK